MQIVINLTPASLSNTKVNFYTCPRLTFLKKNATENAFKSIFVPLDFKIFWGGGGGGMSPDPPSGSRLRRSKLASFCSEVWLRPCTTITPERSDVRKKRLESDGEQLKEKSPGKVNSRKTLFAESSTVSDSSDAESGIAGIETFYTQTSEQVTLSYTRWTRCRYFVELL